MKIQKIEYFADFETTSVRVYVKKPRLVKRFKKIEKVMVDVLDPYQSRAFVCAWGISQITNSPIVSYGRTLQDFLLYIKRMIETPDYNANATIFTHNLKFDGAFIEWHALIYNNEYEILEEVRDDQLYSFKLRFKDIDKTVTFRDSSKIFPMKLEKLGLIYGIKKLNGEWDYNKYRDEKTPISGKEWEYLEHDVLIGVKAIYDYRSRGYIQNTQASIAYNQRLKMTYPRFHKEWTVKFKDTEWEKFADSFPSDIRPLSKPLQMALTSAYYGGVTYVNPLFADNIFTDITSYDINSMYPKQMADQILPIGKPIIYNNPTENQTTFAKAFWPCLIYEIKDFSIKIKSDHHFPIAMFPTLHKETTVRCQGKVIECKNEHALLTDIDLDIIKAEYEIQNMTISKIYAFKGKKGIYKKFVSYWMNKKAEATIELSKAKKRCDDDSISKWEAERAIAKTMLNSCYGKDGTKPIRESKKAKLTDGLLNFETTLEEPASEFYLPHAIYITAHARRQLYDAVKIVGMDHFYYCDTDSVKVDKEGKRRLETATAIGDIEIDDTKLGAWKNEGTYEKAIFVRQKTYATFNNGKWSYIACGATQGIKDAIDIKAFHPGMTLTLDDLRAQGLEGKLRPVSVQGGVILEECGFQISEQEGWEFGEGKNLPISLFQRYLKGDFHNGEAIINS